MCFAPQLPAILHLRTRRFSEPTFRPSGGTNHLKNTMYRDFRTFSRTCAFFLLTLSPLWSSLFFSSPLWLFPPLVFQLSILSEDSLLNFLRKCVFAISSIYKKHLHIFTFIYIHVCVHSVQVPKCEFCQPKWWFTAREFQWFGFLGTRNLETWNHGFEPQM